MKVTGSSPVMDTDGSAGDSEDALKYPSPKSAHFSVTTRCSSVGRAGALGASGRRFEPCHLDEYGLVVQLARTSDLHSEGRGFESLQVHQHTPLAQLEEHLPYMQRVGSSNLSGCTKYIK